MSHSFDLNEARFVLLRTPRVLDAWLRGLPDAWLDITEGGATWSPRIVVGHLIVGEESDWISRVRQILGPRAGDPFAPFDRFAQFQRPRRSIEEMLDEFAILRARSLAALEALALGPPELERRGVHPEFGPVSLRQHLATWVAHDLSHLAQIARVMARRYQEDVGPWRAYLRILNE